MAFWMPFDSSKAFNTRTRRTWLLPALISTITLSVLQAISPISANWMAIGLFLLGVPHGAVERTDDKPLFIMPTLSYTALYIVFGILIFSSWLISPLGTLILFLLLSAWHFGESEPHIRTIGIWVIIGSCLLYPVQTLGTFALLIAHTPPEAYVINASQILAMFGLFAVAVEFILRQRAGQRPSLSRLSFLIGLFLILPPIPAVAVYFFAFHGMGEFSRTLASVSRAGTDLKFRDILILYGPATFPAMIGAVMILALTYKGYIPVLIASGMAISFIIPHMLPVEKLLRVDRDVARNNLH